MSSDLAAQSLSLIGLVMPNVHTKVCSKGMLSSHYSLAYGHTPTDFNQME